MTPSRGRWLRALTLRPSPASLIRCPGAGPESELTIINIRNGAVQLAGSVRLLTTEDAAWVTWLAGGEQLLAGAISASYAVNAATLAARRRDARPPKFPRAHVKACPGTIRSSIRWD
jgi:hypothetical protein